MNTIPDPNEAIPLPPPANNTLLTLRARNASNSASIPSASNMMPNFFNNPAIQPSSVINLTNSSDVVIGPMTQYQGPVTIYQYMDATVEARAMQSNGGITNNRNNQSTTVLERATRNSKILIALVFIVVILAGVAIFYIYQSKSAVSDDNRPKEILFGNNYADGVMPNLGNGHFVIDRVQWGSSERSVQKHRLHQPIPYVMISHVGVQSSPCYNVYKCSIKMRTLQDAAIAEKNFTDIPANFYVGNDGYIYVGRGWDYTNAYANKSLTICFMGDYIRHEPDEKQFEAVQYLLSYGITNKHITIDYKLVAQNQTKTTKSPGANVFREIIKWPHWYPCGMENNITCGEEIGITNWASNL